MVDLEGAADPVNVENMYLSGQILIAMPGMSDPRFEKSVIYVCAHNEEGAMGLVVNRPIQSMTFPEMLHVLRENPRG